MEKNRFIVYKIGENLFNIDICYRYVREDKTNDDVCYSINHISELDVTQLMDMLIRSGFKDFTYKLEC